MSLSIVCLSWTYQTFSGPQHRDGCLVEWEEEEEDWNQKENTLCFGSEFLIHRYTYTFPTEKKMRDVRKCDIRARILKVLIDKELLNN